MDKKDLDKTIGYGVGIIIIYFVISSFIQYIIAGVVLMIVWRVHKEVNKHK